MKPLLEEDEAGDACAGLCLAQGIAHAAYSLNEA